METTNDIFNEMRNWDYHSDLDLNAHEVLSQYADRFWEAHRREVEQYLKSIVKCDKEIARLKNGHSNLEEIITKLKAELGEAAKWTRAELSRELAMNVELNNNLREENSRLTEAMKPVLDAHIPDFSICDTCRDMSECEKNEDSETCEWYDIVEAVREAKKIYSGGAK